MIITIGFFYVVLSLSHITKLEFYSCNNRFLQQGLVFAARHFLSLTPLDFVEENGSSLLVPADTTRNENSVKIETSLPFRRRFNCIVLAHGCDQHPVTETTEISKLTFSSTANTMAYIIILIFSSIIIETNHLHSDLILQFCRYS